MQPLRRSFCEQCGLVHAAAGSSASIWDEQIIAAIALRAVGLDVKHSSVTFKRLADE